MILDQFLYTSAKTQKTTTATTSQDSTVRSIVKSVSWRVIGTIDTVLISYFLTGEINTAFAIGGVELITKMVLYVAHERVWNCIKFGRRP
ncbi:DUF2061 domain-containing protein [Nonlabens ponticola]|uniref:DUF2061 domain-containing protein n=1 Tax=Nonlabens ponticola TaxID=2496866 RepID=A0A3S9MWG5_9FLAO|nr:DUF2061 domain-containing protein [Nonlabens ponticola]AZQ43551.1 DUF2061 domain-containing protein [Nonlabens ponticola]